MTWGPNPLVRAPRLYMLAAQRHASGYVDTARAGCACSLGEGLLRGDLRENLADRGGKRLRKIEKRIELAPGTRSDESGADARVIPHPSQRDIGGRAYEAHCCTRRRLDDRACVAFQVGFDHVTQMR